MTLQDDLSALLGERFAAAGFDAALGDVRPSDRPDLAQFQCNGALAAAKAAKRNPREVAAEIVDSLADDPRFSAATVAGPGFINLILSPPFLADRLDALAVSDSVGLWRTPSPEKIIVDYGGPNVAKPLHVGHLRAAIIGESIKRLARAVGDTVIGDAHLGDWGLQMGQLISELELRRPDLVYFDAEKNGPYPTEPPVSLADLEAMYPAASAACKSDEARADLARRATKALQDGRPGYVALWRHFVTLSVAAMKRDYADLDVDFDLWKGEADADPLIPEIAADLVEKGLLEHSDGAEIIRVARPDDKKEMPPIIFRNSQGAVGYHATDIATIVDRQREFDPDRMLYVVDGRQRLHFEQVFRAASLAGYFDEQRLEHLWFGTMNGQDGKPFKTRAGGTLKLRDLIDMVTDRAAERLKEGGFAENFSDEERASIARQVGVAALKFADLANQRTSDYVFDVDRFTRFEGKTGPYLLYAVVRIRSVLERAAAADAGEAGPVVLEHESETQLGLTLLSFGEAVRDAYNRRFPHVLCEHAFNLAQAFSKFYSACRIKDETDLDLRASRLRLTEITGRQLTLTLDLLGITTPARM